jgi:acyl transferase domain-containing protein
VPTACIPWPTQGLRRISVDSFGFGGANSHLILDDALHTIEALALVGNHRTLTSPSLSNGMNGVNRAISNTNGVDGVNHEISNTNGVDGVNHEISKANGVNGVNHAISKANGVNGVNHAISKANGVNGVNGANHAINKSSKATPGYQLLTWSARDEAALKRMLHLYDGYLKTSMHGDANFLGDLAYTLAARRTLMAWRSFSIVDGQGDPETLDLPAAKRERAARDVGVAFIFTGQGAQYANMGMELLRYPIFKATLAEVDGIFQQLGAEWSLFGKHSVRPLAQNSIR